MTKNLFSSDIINLYSAAADIDFTIDEDRISDDLDDDDLIGGFDK